MIEGRVSKTLLEGFEETQKATRLPANLRSCFQDFLVSSDSLQDLPNIKSLTGAPNRYRIRVGDYRIGLELRGDTVELMRVLHRREF